MTKDKKPKVLPSDKELFDALEEALGGKPAPQPKPDIEIKPTKVIESDYPIQRKLNELIYYPKDYRGLREVATQVDINKLISKISNTPEISQEDIMRIAAEIGVDPRVLVKQSLGSVLVDKKGIPLNKPTEDILNELYGDNPVPGERIVFNPKTMKDRSTLANQLRKEMPENVLGSMFYEPTSKSGGVPKVIAVKDLAKDEIDKLSEISTAAHEMEHGSDVILGHSPDVDKAPRSFAEGHHARKGIFELGELIDQVKEKGNPEKAKKLASEAAKIGKSKPFKRLLSAIPLIGAIPSYQEAREKGLSVPTSVGYAGVEQANPIPISPIEYVEGMEEAAKGRAENMEQNFNAVERLRNKLLRNEKRR